MKNLNLIALTCATLCLTGCFTVDSAKSKVDGAEHVYMNNYGWQFFDWIPLVCGNATPDATFKTAFFRDDVTVEKIQANFAHHANGRTVEDPVFLVDDRPYIMVFGIPIPYLITYKEITLSGTIK